MELGMVGGALEREHHEIDAGITGFMASVENGDPEPEQLRRAVAALRRHIYIEEQFLFPPMHEELVMPTMVMLREHGDIWRTLDKLEQELGDAPADAAITCRELMARLATHNQKEEPIFYTQTDRALSAEENSELMTVIETGELPDGWVCRDAIVPEKG
jgi:hemerythrin-like domain-containing protein